MHRPLFFFIAILSLASCAGEYSYNSTYSSIKQASSSVVPSAGNSNTRINSTNFRSSITGSQKNGSTTLGSD